MTYRGDGRRRAVVALGGNALLRRGEPPEAANQARAAREAARILARASTSHRLVITHGNGPQVGLLALMSDAYKETEPYPLDVLDAETAGQIGYVLEMQLDNYIDDQDTATVITRVVVDADDPAFESPSKFIGPLYTEDEASALADRHGWTVRPDGKPTRATPPGAARLWRRVVPSPEPRRIVQLGAIERLVEAGFIVVCAGGGGVPVVEDAEGRHRGVEAVIDKDLASALLAIELGVDVLVLATDVDAVYDGYGLSEQLPIARATPEGLRARKYPAGSMGPKVEATCRFVESTDTRAAIGSLDDIEKLLDGSAGTQVSSDGPRLEYRQRGGRRERVA
jgi:carbamate kinase